MEKWFIYAIIAAIFIAIRDIMSKEQIINKYSYTEYIIIANILIFIGTIIYIIFTKKNIKDIKIPSLKGIGFIIVRLVIVYLIIEPCIFYSIKFCKNPGYANSVINLNTLFVLIILFIFYKEKLDKKKMMGVSLLMGGAYLMN